MHRNAFYNVYFVILNQIATLFKFLKFLKFSTTDQKQTYNFLKKYFPLILFFFLKLCCSNTIVITYKPFCNTFFLRILKNVARKLKFSFFFAPPSTPTRVEGQKL